MNDAALVRIVQRLGALENNLYDVVDAQQVIRSAIALERAGTLDVLHDDVVIVILLAGVI